MRVKLRHDLKSKIVLLDTETEGLNLALTKTWQVSWLVAYGSKVEKIENRFIWQDDLKMSKGAAFVTGFDIGYYETTGKTNKTYRINKQIVQTESAEEVWADFEKELDDAAYIVGQNILGFDIYMMQTWYFLMTGKPLDCSKWIDRIIDTRCVEMCIMNNGGFQDSDSIPLFMYRWLHHRDRKIKTSQKAMLDRYGIDYDEDKLHDAKYDIEKLFEIFRKQIYKLSI